MASKNIWIMAGETSGDNYGAGLAAELRKLAAAEGTELRLSGMGGKAMKAAGVPVLVDSTELGVVGILEVVKSLAVFVRIFFQLVRQARRERPDTVVLIDYPGFNLLFALAMYRAGIPVCWYVCPQIWVWGKWRKPVLAKICTKMLVIFPFETEVFAGTGLKPVFVGHPLVETVRNRRDPAIVRDPDLVLLLPGSRRMEIDKLLRPLLESAAELKKRHPQLRFHLVSPREKIAAVCGERIAAFRRKHPELPEITLSTGDTGKWLQQAGTGLAASGTVTVECALAGLPLTVGYKLNYLTLLLAAVLVKLYRGFFTMVNIIAGKEVFREFLQWHCEARELVPAVEKILPGGPEREQVEQEMAAVAAALGAGSKENALARAAKEIYTVQPPDPAARTVSGDKR